MEATLRHISSFLLFRNMSQGSLLEICVFAVIAPFSHCHEQIQTARDRTTLGPEEKEKKLKKKKEKRKKSRERTPEREKNPFLLLLLLSVSPSALAGDTCGMFRVSTVSPFFSTAFCFTTVPTHGRANWLVAM